MDGFTEEKIEIASYSEVGVGKKFKSTKVEHVYEFFINGKQNILKLVKSSISGKLRILLNENLLHFDQRYLSLSRFFADQFRFDYNIADVKINITHKAGKFEVNITRKVAPLAVSSTRCSPGPFANQQRSTRQLNIFANSQAQEPARQLPPGFEQAFDVFGGPEPFPWVPPVLGQPVSHRSLQRSDSDKVFSEAHVVFMKTEF